MTSPVLLHGPDRAPALRSHHGEGARKIFFGFMPRNPLKSLDSGERIRRNPRKFKSHERDRGPSRRNGDGPRKLKNGSRPAAKGANPTPSKPKAQLRPPARVEGVSQLAIFVALSARAEACRHVPGNPAIEMISHAPGSPISTTSRSQRAAGREFCEEVLYSSTMCSKLASAALIAIFDTP